MKPTASRSIVAALLVAALFSASPARAQFGDLLKKGGDNTSSGGLGGLGDVGGALGGALGGKSAASGSLGNVTGLLEFCIKNNYLGGGAASIKDSLMGKLGGGSAAKADNDYKAGGMGILKSADGKQLDLSGAGAGGLKEKVTKQACDAVLSQAKSFM